MKWAAASAGGWTLLYTVDLSGAENKTQNVDFTGYQQAVIILDNAKDAITAWNLETRLNASTTGHYFQVISNDSASVVNGSNTAITQQGSGGAQKQNGRTDYYLLINNPASTTKFKSFHYIVTYTRNDGSSTLWTQSNAGFFRSDSAITSIRWSTSSTDFTAGSQALVYGVK